MVLVQSPTTTTAINSTTNNDYLSFPTDMSGPNPSAVGVSPQISSAPYFDSHGFGVCQLTTVGTSDATIRTLVLIPISASPYRKVLIAKIFFRQIFGYADSPSISINDLVSTVSLYFDMSTATAEWEAEAAAIAICDSLFLETTYLMLASSLQRESPSLLMILTTTHATFLTLLFAPLLILTPFIFEHQITFIGLNFLCAYLTIPVLLQLIFRCQILLLLPIKPR